VADLAVEDPPLEEVMRELFREAERARSAATAAAGDDGAAGKVPETAALERAEAHADAGASARATPAEPSVSMPRPGTTTR
jgi:hypothetical protein